jgi:hypothetical protein
LNHIERDLLQAHIFVRNAMDMLRDARRILLPHLPDTSSEVEKARVAITATQGVCKQVHVTLCAIDARRKKKIVLLRSVR